MADSAPEQQATEQQATEQQATEQGVLDLVEESDLVALTTALVRVPGVNPPGEEGPRAATLAAACRDRGFSVSEQEVAPGRPNVRAVLPGGDGPGLLLLGHTDVVLVGDGWTLDPFGGELRDGRIHGRGATDMLGGLAACVVAMDAIRRAGIPLSGPVELAALVDEEETGLGIRAHTSQLVAEGRAWAGCLVAEPTDLQTIVAARGDSYLEYDVTGVAAHSGSPTDGRNAITGAARIVADLAAWHDELAARAHPLVGPPTWSVGMINGGQSTSTVAADCHLSVDRRLLPGEDPDLVLAAIRARLDG
ncbi:MAG: M20/M25/M40 family metallo-hydrolase, partial [Propionibacteriaceae bacterium]